jgi:hypothetical protein
MPPEVDGEHGAVGGAGGTVPPFPVIILDIVMN